VEYRVEHEPWRVWDASHAEFSGDASLLYGAEFKDALGVKPYSAFVAAGGPARVLKGRRLAR
jgi:hypothetical protein